MFRKIRYSFSWKLYLIGFCLAIVVVLLIVGRLQQHYVRLAIKSSVDQQLRTEAEHIAKQIAYRNEWALEGYRNEAIDFAMPSTYFSVIDENGLVADLQGKPSGLRNVELPVEENLSFPKTVRTPFNESWRLLSKRLKGGGVVVGKRLPSKQSDLDLLSYDAKLRRELEIFGNTIEEARNISTRHLSPDIDYVVVDSERSYVSGNGGIPIKVKFDQSDNANSRVEILSVPLLAGRDGTPVGSIVLAKDMSVELSTVDELDRTNKFFAAIIALSTFALGIIFLLPKVFTRKSYITIDDALRVGEGKNIEFKSTFQCNYGSPEKVNDKRLAILRAIAGFLNGDGGTLFIGIMEQPPDPPLVRGLPEDLALVENNTDVMRRTLFSLIADRLGKQFSDFISDRMEERNGNLCWVINVARSPEPAFVKWKAEGESKEQKHFYVREGPRTADLDLENTYRYIRNRWRT